MGVMKEPFKKIRKDHVGFAFAEVLAVIDVLRLYVRCIVVHENAKSCLR